MVQNPEHSKALSILSSAVENTNEAFVTIDSRHRVLFFNKAAERIFGYSREEVLGRDLDVIMAPGCSRNHHEAVDRYIKTRQPRRIGHDTEILATRKGGETFSANISFSVSEVNGELYFTGIVRDLTETKALQEQIVKSERFAALGQFAAEITHEIKNPLMMIGGFAEQLTRATKDAQSLTKLRIISQEISRLENLLKEIREFYSPRSLNTEVLDLHAVVREVYDLVSEDCRLKHVEARFSESAEPVRVDADRGKLKQVLINLVKNAVESMENGGHLRVEVERAGDRGYVRIADDGCGIPEKDRVKLFSPFFTTKKQGTGLGLSISKGIIEDHRGGALTVESEEGKGTTFTISLPVHETLEG